MREIKKEKNFFLGSNREIYKFMWFWDILAELSLFKIFLFTRQEKFGNFIIFYFIISRNCIKLSQIGWFNAELDI